jgi:hypothetical protein
MVASWKPRIRLLPCTIATLGLLFVGAVLIFSFGTSNKEPSKKHGPQPPYFSGPYVNESAIPSHIWTFWADCPPQIVLAFMKTWCMHNPGYKLTVLTLKNYKSHISDLDLNKLRIKDSMARVSDILRLHALAEHGGIWMDATMLCTTSLSWVHSIQVAKQVEYVGFYISSFTNNMKYPIFESWFFACIPKSPLVTAWRDEFMQLQKYGHAGKYIKALKAEGVDLQWLEVSVMASVTSLFSSSFSSAIPEYLAIHASMQKVLQTSGKEFKYHVHDCILGPLRYLADADWHSGNGVVSLVRDPKTRSEVIKLRSWERKVIVSSSLWTTITPFWYFITGQDFFCSFWSRLLDYENEVV